MSPKLEQTLQSYYGAERRRDDLGLDGTRALLEALGAPETRFRSVHVAGTNGKGSVCVLVERALRAAGVRTGLYTSPHLVDFRERMRVNGRWAPGERLERRLEFLRGMPAGQGRTFFEVSTALAFDHFAAEEVEWAVVEVGLGGRLDCTNVIRPAVAAITGIALDHTEILGTSLAAVAREKAGIVKPGVPLVTGDLPEEAEEVVVAEARERGAPHRRARARVRLEKAALDERGARLTVTAAPWGALDLALALRGSHQVGNAVTALAVLGELAERGLDVPAAAVTEGFAAARWPGRLEPCPFEPALWWDAAHNTEGMERLARAWREDLRLPTPEFLILAVSQDKDAAAMLRALDGFAGETTLVATRAGNPRARDPQELAEEAKAGGWARVAFVSGVKDAVELALLNRKHGRVLLAGSIFAIGEAMQALGGAPGEQQ